MVTKFLFKTAFMLCALAILGCGRKSEDVETGSQLTPPPPVPEAVTNAPAVTNSPAVTNAPLESAVTTNITPGLVQTNYEQNAQQPTERKIKERAPALKKNGEITDTGAGINLKKKYKKKKK